MNKSNEENKKIKQQNLKKKKKISKLENELNNQNNELKNKLEELSKKINNENNQYNNNIIEKIQGYLKQKDEKIKILEKYIKENQLKLTEYINLKKPFELEKIPSSIGLNNIGAANYMNSVLQCLSQTKELTKYFLTENNENRIINNNIAYADKNALQLSPIYLELIKKLWDKNKG